MRIFLITFLFAASLRADPFPSTTLLDWPEDDLSERLMNGAHHFADRKIDEANRARLEKGPANKEELRKEFREMIGVVDKLAPTRLSKFSALCVNVCVCVFSLGRHRVHCHHRHITKC